MLALSYSAFCIPRGRHTKILNWRELYTGEFDIIVMYFRLQTVFGKIGAQTFLKAWQLKRISLFFNKGFFYRLSWQRLVSADDAYKFNDWSLRIYDKLYGDSTYDFLRRDLFTNKTKKTPRKTWYFNFCFIFSTDSSIFVSKVEVTRKYRYQCKCSNFVKTKHI